MYTFIFSIKNDFFSTCYWQFLITFHYLKNIYKFTKIYSKSSIHYSKNYLKIYSPTPISFLITPIFSIQPTITNFLPKKISKTTKNIYPCLHAHTFKPCKLYHNTHYQLLMSKKNSYFLLLLPCNTLPPPPTLPSTK